METLSCAFFGHKKFDYKPYENDIREAVEDLINRGVTEFYNCNIGQFDATCAQIVRDLKAQYPHVKSILVLSYIPDEKFVQPTVFDETVYLSEKTAPYVYDIAQFNQRIIETVDYVIFGVARAQGDAKAAFEYAKELCRSWYNVVTDDEEFWNVLPSAKEVAQIEKTYAEEFDKLSIKLKEIVPKNDNKPRKVARRRKEYAEPVWVKVKTKKTTEN